MRTRKASIVERTVIYILIVVCIVAIGAIAFFQHSKYAVLRAQKEEELVKAQEELDAKKKTLDEKTGVRNLRKKEVERKQREDELKQKEYELTLEILNKTLVNLPPIEVWPDLIKKIEILASDLKIKIANFTIIANKDLQGKIKKDFTEFYFTLELEGEYSKMLEYLWNLENSIQLKRDDSATIWKAIIKVIDGGFAINNLITQDDTMKLQLTLTTFFRGGR